MNNNCVAISVLGKDRPGIVAGVTKVLFKLNCNIEDSSMTKIENEFAMILIARLIKKNNLQNLKIELKKAAKRLDLSILIRPMRKSEEKIGCNEEKNKNKNFIISIYSADKPGIVYGVANFLATKNINITDLKTNLSENVYIMQLEINLLPKIDLTNFRRQLKELGKQLKAEINLNSFNIPIL